MSFESLPEHLRRPHLRTIQPVPVKKDGKQFVALRDPSMLSSQTMVLPVKALEVIQQFQGQRTLQQIAEKFAVDESQQLIHMVKSMDQIGLLWGPTFDKLEAEKWDDLRNVGCFPIRASRSLGEDDAACRAALDSYFDQTDDPEIEGSVYGIIAPHLDYARGWPNYAAAYYPWRTADAPDRVVIFGTNHFGPGDGVVLTELGFDTPLGTSRADTQVVANLVEALGRPLVVDQLDHLAEHSIELHVPWIRYCFGDVPIVAALVPDPILGMIQEDDQRIATSRFVEAMRAALDEAGGTTFYVASSDLSHVGPHFGEPRRVDDQRRLDVEKHDREMMSKFLDGDAEEFIAAMKWNKNPTRWCSIGNMSALLMLAEPTNIELIDYRQAIDDQGVALVSCAAMALVDD